MEPPSISNSVYSLNNLQRQTEQLSPQELKEFVLQDSIGTRRPSVLEKESETCQCCTLKPKGRAYKNVIGAGVSFTLTFSALIALISLQSSLNEAEGLGYGHLIVYNVVFIVFGLFMSSVINFLGTKYSIILAYFFSLAYAVANFYPQWYTLVPAAVCGGLADSIMHAGNSIHVTNMAIKYAPALNEKTDHLIAFYNGIITMFFKLSYIPGNLATTAILFSERTSAGKDIIDTSLEPICNNTDAANLDQTYVYILMSSFVLINIAAIAIAFLFIDHPGTKPRRGSALKFYIKDPVVSTLKVFKDWKMCLLVLMMPLPAFLTVSILGIVLKFLISDCIGVHWVGLMTMGYGICSALSAVVTGRLFRYVPPFLMVYFFSAVMLGTTLFLLFWERRPSYLVPFLPLLILGLCEGMWFNIPPTLVGILFPKNKVPAFTVIRMSLGVGYTAGFAVPLLAPIAVSFWIANSLIVVSVVSYSILVFITHSREQLFPLCYRKKSN
ncbi:PREDICTED: protein unc-93 homolog A-like [Amphimedon queenslandica]|uniref:Uncharacterized protein n=1 Tax=Amphimedon queenslandica TaxID=400682 RepID=A0AAN0IU30_AMPQE|nr:PREDICTED: protein unc-93 homolog A-like [Amphimedon queenslandica]|eukprot:XP_011409961.1 PREDICTED: protein unc-93 homolog A-like [Amphimedon queenslandica]